MAARQSILVLRLSASFQQAINVKAQKSRKIKQEADRVYDQNKQNLSFQEFWKVRRPWLTFEAEKDTMFCQSVRTTYMAMLTQLRSS